MICPQCGREVQGKFCPACGIRLTETDETVVLSAENNPYLNRPQPEAPKADSAPVNNGYNPPVPPAYGNPAPNNGQQGYAQPPYGGQAPQGYAQPPQGYGQPQTAGYTQNAFVPNGGYNQPGGFGPQGETPARALLKKLAGSGLFFTAALCMTLTMLISVGSGVYNLIQLPKLGGYYPREYLDSLRTSTLVSLVITVVGVGILVIAAWSIYANGASKKGRPMKTGGLTTFKVYMILGIIAVCVMVLIMLVVVGFAVAAGGEAGINEAFSQLMRAMSTTPGMEQIASQLNGLIGVVIGVTVAAIILSIVYMAKTIKSLNTAKRIIATGLADDRISPFVGVMIFIGVVFSCLGVVGMIFQKQYLNAASMAVGAVGSACFGVLLFKARSGMRQLGAYNGAAQAVAPAQPVQRY